MDKRVDSFLKSLVQFTSVEAVFWKKPPRLMFPGNAVSLCLAKAYGIAFYLVRSNGTKIVVAISLADDTIE